nr:amidohydrolase family protein [uncultured Desulfobulbus sp.]
MSGPRIHRALWVVPVDGAVLSDGAIAVDQGKIVAVDSFAAVAQQYPCSEVIEHSGVALTPALINGHIHLELSHLAELSATPLATTFTGWIVELLSLRDRLGVTGAEVEKAASRCAERQYLQGTSVLADIGNTSIGHHLAENFAGDLVAHKEYLGLAGFTLAKNLTRLREEPEDVRCSAHAPYSTHPQLIQALKRRARSCNHIFPIHVAEPLAEGEMLAQGRGEMVDFVRDRGFWDDSFEVPGNRGSIRYLYGLDVLDAHTLCVHAVHLDHEEIRILAGEGGKVCLCPGSNRFLQVGKAPLEAFLAAGILPALGTDSVASNPELSLWREMAIIATDYPYVDPAQIFAMATKGGAEALGIDKQLGTLARGKNADILAIPVPAEIDSPQQLMRYLATAENRVQPTRILV